MKNDMKALKAQAKNLRAALKQTGIDKPLAYAQELIAQQYGQPNWDTLCGIVVPAPDTTPLRLADLPRGAPTEVFVEAGLSTDSFNVGDWDDELIFLADSQEKVSEYLEAHREVYPQGLDSTVMYLQGDGFDREVTVRDLLEGRYKRLGGRDYWYLPTKDWYLSFYYASPDAWQRDKPAHELTVTEVVKSVKGVRLVRLPSTSGSQWDLYVMVPPHLDALVISQKLQAELDRLREQDNAHQDDKAYDEYTSKDIDRFVRTLGCALAEPALTTGIWD